MKSLRASIVSGLLLSLIAVFVIQWLLVTVAIRKVTENYAATRLEHEIESLVAALQFDPQGRPQIEPARVNQFYQRPFSGHYFRISADGQELRSRSLWDWRLQAPRMQTGEQTRMHVPGPQSQPLLALVHGFSKQGTVFTVTVAEDLSGVNADIRRFQNGYALLSALLLIATLALAAWTVTRGLRPLQRARADLAALEGGSISVLDERVPREIAPLVQEVNRLLQLTRQRLERSRKATGNLAHGLKTPLTILSQLRDDPALAHADTLRSNLEAQVARIKDLIERELKLARLAGSGPSAAPFEAARELPDLVATLERLYAARGIRIDLQVRPGHRFHGDREDMLELIGNLLDNACKWARERVRVTVEDAPGLNIVVADDGPGVDEQRFGELLRRGARLDEGHDGHGLGLAIVGDIVRQYGGALELSRAALGGLQVSVHLPPPTTPTD